MPRVPTYDQNVVPLARTTDARFAAAAGADAAAGLGAGLQRLGGAMGEAAQVQDEIDFQFDDTMRKKLALEWQTGARDLVQGFKAMQGANAISARPDTEAKLADLRKSITERATTPRMRKMLEDTIAGPDSAYKGDIGGHALEQLKIETAQVNAARVTDAANNAAENWQKPDVRAGYIQAGLSAIDEHGKDQGWAPDVTAVEKRKFTSGVHSTIVDQLLLNDKVEEADAYAREHDGELTFDDRRRIAASLKGPLELRESAGDFQRAVGFVPPTGDVSQPANAGKEAKGRPGPVPNGVQVTQALYPQARVTSGYRAPDDPLSKANPKSWHTNSHAAVDVAPIKGMSFDEYLQGYRDAGYQIIEAKNEVGDGRSAHATGDHWHVVLGGSGNLATGAQQRPREWDLNKVYGQIDGLADKEGWGLERRERAKAWADKQVSRDERLKARDEQDARDKAFGVLNRLGPDGFTSINQIPASIRERLSPEVQFSLRESADRNAKEQQQRAAALNFYNTLASSGSQFNPYDDNQKKAVEAAVRAKGGGADAAFAVWQQTGILAESGSTYLRGGLVSTDARQVRQAANIAGNMLRKNPNAFAGVPGGDDIERAALAFNHYVYDLGMAPDQASARVAKENTPEFKSKAKLTDADVKAFRDQIRNNGVDAARAIGGDFRTPQAKAEANQTLADLTLDNVQQGYDLPTAQSMAAAQMKRMYAKGYHGNFEKYAPEMAYPAINGGHGYVYGDARATVKAETGIDSPFIELKPIPGVTDDDIRNGRPARYSILFQRKSNGQTVIDTLPGQFAVDMGKATAAATAARKKQFDATRASGQAQARQELDRINRESRYGGVRGG